MSFSHLLPLHNQENETEMIEIWINRIEANIKECLEAEIPSFTWAQNIHQMLSLDINLSATFLLKMGSLLYNLVLSNHLLLTTKTLSIFPYLFRNELLDNLDDYTPEELEIDPDLEIVLDWRLAYTAIKSILEGKFVNDAISHNLLSPLLDLIQRTNYLYSEEASQEILDCFLPLLNRIEFDTWCYHSALLCNFLPKRINPTLSKKKKERDLFYWVPGLFKLWKSTRNCIELDYYYTSLFSKLSFHQRTNQEFKGFSEEQIQFIFLKASATLQIPIGKEIEIPGLFQRLATCYGSHISSSSLVPEEFYSDIKYPWCILVVYNIESSCTLNCLEDTVSTVATFCHPANHGEWTINIFSFLHYTTTLLLRRWNEEQGPKTTIPISKRLSRETIEKITKLFLPLLLFGIFGKDNQTLDMAQVSLKQLCWLCPNIAFPGIIPKLVPALETLTEAHRTSAALTTLCLLSPSMLKKDHYPSAMQHFVTFLHLAIPGIDFNDMKKTYFTCLFYAHSLMHVPIVDCSLHSPISIDSPNIVSSSPANLSASIASTSGFSSWLKQLFESIFNIYKSLPENFNNSNSHRQASSAEDDSLLSIIETMSSIVFAQVSDELNELVLELLVHHLQGTVIPSAAESIGSLVLTVSPRNKKRKFEVFFEMCEKKIRNEIEIHGAGKMIQNSSDLPFGYGKMSDSVLHWYQEILVGLIGRSGGVILELGLQHRVESLLELMVSNLVTVRGTYLTSSAVISYAHSMAAVYPINLSSLTLKEWGKDVTVDQWGIPYDMHHVTSDDIEWHIPTHLEIKISTAFIAKYIDLAIDNLNRLILEPNRSYHETQRWLRLLQSCSEISHLFLAPQCAPNDTFLYNWKPIEAPLQSAGWLFNDPASSDYQFWRAKISRVLEFLSRFTEYFLKEENQSDTDSVKILCACIEDFFMYDFRRGTYLNMANQWNGILCIRGNPTSIPRMMRICKVAATYYARLQYCKQMEPLRPELKKLALCLVDLSVCIFRKVRISSQNYLQKIMNHRPELAIPCLTKTVYILLTSPLLKRNAFSEGGNVKDDDSRVKGALHLLRGSVSYSSHCKYDPDFMFLYLKALVRWATVKITLEDPLMDLIVNTMNSYLYAFSFSGYGFHIPPECKKNLNSAPFFKKELADFSAKIVLKSRTSHKELVEYLLSVRDDSNWKLGAFTVQLLQELVAGDILLTEKMVDFSFDYSTHENQSIRKHAIYLLQLMIKNLKTRAKKNGTYLVTQLNIKLNVKRGDPLYEQIQASWLDWENKDDIYCDDMLYGYIAWPKELKVFKGSIPIGSGLTFQVDADASLALNALIRNATSKEYWKKFIDVVAMEAETNDDDILPELGNISLISRIVNLIREDFIDVIIEPLTHLIENSIEIQCQKAAVEILASLYTGSKLFPPESLKKLDDLLIPLITKGINNCTTGSLKIWKYFFDTVYSYRDPKRFLSWTIPYFKQIQKTESTSFFAQSRHLTFLDSLIASSKISPKFVEVVLQNLLELKTSVYNEIREKVGSIIELCISHLSRSACNTAEIYLSEAISDICWNPSPHPLLEYCFTLDLSSHYPIDEKDEAVIDLVNTGKTALQWYNHALCSWSATSTLPYIGKFLDNILIFGSLGEADLLTNIDQTLLIFSTYIFTPKTTVTIQKRLQIFLSQELFPFMNSEQIWHFRVRFLNVLEKFYVTNIYSLDSPQRQDLIDTLCKLLQDSSLEVRQLASIKLITLIRNCKYNAIKNIKEYFLTMLNENKITRKRGQEKDAAYYSTVNSRHTAVLGLCAIILSFPYNMPDFLPEIIVAITKCISDPSPIQGTVRKTFLEFKSTHQETWDVDKLLFKEEDLYLITDLLISPNYYA